MRWGENTEPDSSGLAMLAHDLNSMVDRLQSDWDQRRTVRPEVAKELRKLRQRAETMLCTFAGA